MLACNSLLWACLSVILGVFFDQVISQEQWAVQINAGDEVADQVANQFGYINKGKIPHLNNKYIFEDKNYDRMKRSLYPHHISKRLSNHPEVSWADYASPLSRHKRDFMEYDNNKFAKSVSKVTYKKNNEERAVSDFSPQFLNENATSIFRDPLWPSQWYLHDTRKDFSLPKLDLHVLPAWKRNLTGRGVKIAIVDDGLEWQHPDIAANYDPDISYDVNNDRPDPTPAYDLQNSNRHGTRCAGEVAMVANNSYCGVGIAFNSKIGGIKILDGKVNDIVEARGLSHNVTYTDIYSASWGPADNGKSLEGPGPLASEALEVGVTKGRSGKGVIYVWAAGNGGMFNDDCNCDGYANSVYTLSVNSVTQSLKSPWYTENCAAALVSDYSSGSYTDQKIVSADLKGKCTVGFTGTSASAPVAAGIIALMLEANPGLTWRDVQHAIVWTSEVAPIFKNVGWKKNGFGLYYHKRMGFGMFNVDTLTSIVEPGKWKNVPDKAVLKVDKASCSSSSLTSQDPVICKSVVTKSMSKSVRYLEHVQLKVSLTYTTRGVLSVYVISPSGTVSQVLSPRNYDVSKKGLKNWTFMSVHFWGENPAGEWQFRFEDNSGALSHEGIVQSVELILHGTAAMPALYRHGPRKYNKHYNQVHNVKQSRPELNPNAELIDKVFNSLYHHELHRSGYHRLRPEADYLLNLFKMQKSSD